MPEPVDQEIQSKYYELQTIGEQLKQLQQQAQVLEEQNTELQAVLSGLEDIGKTPDGTEILVPLNQGIYARARLTDKSSFIVTVGENILVEKDMTNTRLLMQDRQNTVQAYEEETLKNIQAMTLHAKALERELKALVENVKKGKNV